MTQTQPDSILLERLKENEQEAYLLLYQLHYPDLARYKLYNSYNREDAEDLFQETLLVLLHKIRKADFTLNSELKTFLYAINRSQWLKVKKMRSRQIPFSSEDVEHVDALTLDVIDIEKQQHQIKKSQKKIFFKWAIKIELGY